MPYRDKSDCWALGVIVYEVQIVEYFCACLSRYMIVILSLKRYLLVVVYVGASF